MSRSRSRTAPWASIALSVLLIIMASGGSAVLAKGLPITDPALLNAIDSHSESPEYITRLRASSIVSLEGIENLRSLETLSLYDSDIADLSPLLKLPNLARLELLSAGSTLDFDTISQLTGLETLFITDSGLRDLSFLSNLLNLQYLDLSSNEVLDVEPLSRLKKLRFLYLDNNRITDVTPLASLERLETLSLSKNPIEDIGPLAKLKSLGSLNLDYTNVSDITALKQLKNLEGLVLNFTAVTDLSPLKDLPLKQLFIFGLDPVNLELLPQEVQKRAQATLDDEASFGDYTVRTWSSWVYGYFEILKNGERVYIQDGGVFFIGWDNEYHPEADAPILRIGEDITGRGIPNLLIVEWTGGAHCCIILYLFELGEEPTLLNTLFLGHNDTFYFADITEKPGLELVAYDTSWAYWRTYFAASPAPKIILRFDGSEWAFCYEGMAKPQPDGLELLAILETVQSRIEEMNDTYDVHEPFWDELLDLIYSGHAPLAWKILDLAWPDTVPGKQEFVLDFVHMLLNNPYLEELERLNGGQLFPRR